MFYKQFSRITDVLGGEEIAERFDFWLATLPRINQKNISASTVASQIGINFCLAIRLLKIAEKEGILKHYYIVRCPDCDNILGTVVKGEVRDVLMNGMICEECEKAVFISTNDIFSVYKVIKKPDVSEKDIAKAIDERGIV